MKAVSFERLFIEPASAGELDRGQIAVALAKVAAVQASLLDRLAREPVAPQSLGPTTEPDRLLAPDEAAARLGVTVRWLYRHAGQLPFTRRLGRKTLRFSERGLARHLERGKP